MADAYTEAALFVDEAEEVNASFGEAESDAQNNPTQAPLLQAKDPCSFCSHEDFIVFSEFSEILGPFPLLTVPWHVQDDPELDMNTFILKIMSVDYQANPSGHFGLASDAQVLQTPVIPGVHAYVHYFTLYDIHARGFVRPMCLAFVSRDRSKLEKEFLNLREHFLKVTEIIKLDNRKGFVEDIRHTLNCLRTSQEQYFRLRRMEEECQELGVESLKFLESIDIEQLVNYYAELKNLLHIVEPALTKINDSEMVFQFCNYFIKQKLNVTKGLLILDGNGKLFKRCFLLIIQGNDLLDAELKDWTDMVRNCDLPEAKRLICKLEKHVPKLVNMSGSKRARYIRPAVCISPWGNLATLWRLIDLQTHFSKCSLSVDLNLIRTNFNHSSDEGGVSRRDTSLAFEDADFLKLMSSIIDPKEWADLNTPIIDNLNEHSSSSDSNCSFHSAKPSLLSTSSNDSYQDLDQNLSNWSLSENSENLWSTCLWKNDYSAHAKPGHHILEFFTNFSAIACHLVYSVLVGRVVILAGPKQQKAKAIETILALAPIIPGRSSTSILKWHQGILVSSHLDQYKLVGLCVPERLTVHDLINSQDKNKVTILDLVSKQLLGPAYSGSLLSPLMPKVVSLHKMDQSLILLLHALLLEIDQKVSVCSVAGPVCLSELGLHGCDASIVKYLTQLAAVKTSNNESDM